jgi:phosphate ABC transporter phosphate-binding protein
LIILPNKYGSIQFTINRAMIVALLFVVAVSAALPGYSQTAEKLPQVKSLYVDSLGQSKRSVDLRDRLVRRLEHSHEIEITGDSAKADAVLKGSGQIWAVGEVSLSPHSHSLNAPVLEGYLSVEVVGKDDQTLWSYLATPSKFPWGGIADDLARQTVNKLLEDRKGKAPAGEAIPSGSATAAGASLTGAGATFPAPLYRKWFQSFAEQRPEVHVSYDAVGSGEGIRRVEAGQVDFGASEMPVSEKALAQSKNRLVEAPMVLGAVVPIFNLPDVRHGINFTAQILAGIYLGKIRRWNDPKIKAANREASLPDAEIVVVHRSDASGTSFVWTDYLSKVSPEWKSAVGADVSVKWPIGVGAAYNDGVATAVQTTPNSIGYVELIYAIQHELSYAAVRNSAGEFIKADLASVTEAARASAGTDNSFQFSLTNAPGKFAYPIATYTWLLLPEQLGDKNKKAVLLELVRWMLTSGQRSCSALGYAPLPAEIANNALQLAGRVLGEQGAR